MPTQVESDLPDLFDSLVAPEPTLPADQFSPEFLSPALLEKENHHQEAGMPFLQIPSYQTGTVQAATPNESTNRPHLHNRALRPATRGINPAPPFLCSYPLMPSSSFSSIASYTVADHNSGFSFDNNSKHLERNRAAASRSRRKKKRETDQLQNQFQEVSRRKSRLEIEVKDLNRQLLAPKDQILMHSRCNDETIRIYLERIVKQATRHHSFSYASTGETSDEDDRCDGRPPRERGLLSGVEKPIMNQDLTRRPKKRS
ncbi:hypothetical protein BDW62DRAFT_213224 [Aspergillus aurantiobrunneus]